MSKTWSSFIRLLISMRFACDAKDIHDFFMDISCKIAVKRSTEIEARLQGHSLENTSTRSENKISGYDKT